MRKRISLVNAETHNFENYFSRNAGTLRSAGDAQEEPGREGAGPKGEDEVERGGEGEKRREEHDHPHARADSCAARPGGWPTAEAVGPTAEAVADAQGEDGHERLLQHAQTHRLEPFNAGAHTVTETAQSPADLIRALLKAGWSQEKIADTIGTTQPTVSRILNGDIVSPSWRVFAALKGAVDSLAG